MPGSPDLRHGPKSQSWVQVPLTHRLLGDTGREPPAHKAEAEAEGPWCHPALGGLREGFLPETHDVGLRGGRWETGIPCRRNSTCKVGREAVRASPLSKTVAVRTVGFSLADDMVPLGRLRKGRAAGWVLELTLWNKGELARA